MLCDGTEIVSALFLPDKEPAALAKNQRDFSALLPPKHGTRLAAANRYFALKSPAYRGAMQRLRDAAAMPVAGPTTTLRLSLA